MKKSVVCVWTTQYHPLHRPNIDIGLGFGDMIRGALGLFEYCRENKYDFYLDIQLHPISSILDMPPSPFAEIAKRNEDGIKFIQDASREIEQSSDEFILMATNFCPYENFSHEAKQFMLKVLTPRKWVSDLFESKLALLKLQQYNIMHLRCGDNEFLGIKNNWKRFVARQVALYNYEKGDLLLSDSGRLKNDLSKKANFNVLDGSAVHLARGFDSAALLDTMTEFYAISKASKIKTYSRYSHTSGFVYFPGIIYGIPLELMKMPIHIRILDIVYNLIVLYSDNIFKLFKRYSFAAKA